MSIFSDLFRSVGVYFSTKGSAPMEMFAERLVHEFPRPEDWRTPFSRDRARIIHSSSFRRLQGKTQVMGTGENDFHRTRLTHSLEVAQIGLGLFEGLDKRGMIPSDLAAFAKNCRPILSAACYAHDLGHPPFGHGGEKALHKQMIEFGGFEGNAHTIRLLAKLEKYNKNYGINPTRRVILSVLKYPIAFSAYPQSQQKDFKPPKCYFDTESRVIEWALEPFSASDREEFVRLFPSSGGRSKPRYKSFDASVMECGDDIAYCAHDLEDVVARKLVGKDDLLSCAERFFHNDKKVGGGDNCVCFEDFKMLFIDSYARKQSIGKIINLLMTNTDLKTLPQFCHPLLKYQLVLDESVREFAEFLKTELTYGMVVRKPEVQMLERKGQRLIEAVFLELVSDPEALVPHWGETDGGDTDERRVCDYLAGMTDAFAAKIYHRLFTPGVGSSRDEL